MSEARQLIEEAESETGLQSIAAMLRWWHEAQRVVHDGGEPPEDRIALAYQLGRLKASGTPAFHGHLCRGGY